MTTNLVAQHERTVSRAGYFLDALGYLIAPDNVEVRYTDDPLTAAYDDYYERYMRGRDKPQYDLEREKLTDWFC